MVTIEEIRERLVRNQLLTREACAQEFLSWREEPNQDPTSAHAFIDHLVRQQWITEFQGDALLEGHRGPYRLGAYEVREHLAAGRRGGLFRAVHVEFDHPVTLKVFPAAFADDEEKLARIGRELRVAVELDHPHVIRSFHIGKVGNVYFLAMEALEGETLEACLQREGRLSYAVACRIAHDMASGLAHLHENGIVHRDIRPSNIWLSPPNNAKLLEFGSARDSFAFLDGRSDEPERFDGDSLLGEYDYMAPEQARDAGDADARSDIYALGCTLYRALTGQLPFAEKNPVRLALRHATDDPPPPSQIVEDIPPSLDQTLAAMMAKRPQDRYQTAADAAFALEPFFHDEDPAAVVEVVQWNDQYHQWIESQRPSEDVISDEAVAITPELVGFLNWMTRRKKR